MRPWLDLGAAVLFVLATGLLFTETVRARRILFTLVGIVALASSYVITKQILDATFGHRHHAAATSVAAQAPPAQSESAIADTVLGSVFVGTQTALNRIVRAGTKQSDASVSSDTVVDVIAGLSLAVLGVLSQLFTALFRRLFGAEA